MDAATLGALALIVFVAFTAEATAGFGSILISVTAAAHFVPIAELVPLLIPLNLLLAIYMVTRYRGHVALSLLLRTVLPVMGAGLLCGQLLFHHLAGDALRIGLALVVCASAGSELVRALRGRTPRALGAGARAAWVFCAGVAHGVYATGGPPLVYALGRAGLGKRSFRSTLATVWLIFDLVLIASFAATGRLDAASATHSALLVPVVIVAVAAGELLHRRVDEKRFRIGAFTLLFFGGATLLF